jgi:osmotically-inducible protein OsmY
VNRKTLYSLTFVAAAAALFLTGATLQASDADDKVESSFKKTYVYRTYLKDDAIKAEAKGGVVTLTGTVAHESHKALAEETAAGLDGVTRVDSKLATKAEIAADNKDAWIVKKVQIALLFHRNVNATATTVKAKDGVVTLTGKASSAAQKELTGEYAKDIDGVTSVNNELTVTAAKEPAERTEAEKIDDASISAQVKTALWMHRSTSAVKTTVVTRGGVVTLTGIAKNDAEKSLVTKLADDIHGVKTVKNEMTVEQTKAK